MRCASFRRGERAVARRRCRPRRRRSVAAWPRTSAASSRPGSRSVSTTAAPASASSPPRSSCPSSPAPERRMPWQPAWIGLGAVALVAAALLALATHGRAGPAASAARADGERFRWRPFAPGLVAYLLFGLGYIGYMTFVVTMLREQRLAPRPDHGVLRDARRRRHRLVVAVGAACCSASAAASRSRSSARCSRSRRCCRSRAPTRWRCSPRACCSARCSCRSSRRPPRWFATTSRRRSGPAGIGAFTTMFAAGQIAGPALVGLVADRAGGLRAGLACSAAVLALGALAAWRQKPLVQARPVA